MRSIPSTEWGEKCLLEFAVPLKLMSGSLRHPIRLTASHRGHHGTVQCLLPRQGEYVSPLGTLAGQKILSVPHTLAGPGKESTKKTGLALKRHSDGIELRKRSGISGLSVLH